MNDSVSDKEVDRSSDMLDRAAKTLSIEAKAIESLIPRLGDDFKQAVRRIKTLEGRLVVTGMGKSGAIGRKLAATFASTGTPAFFMHPAEGLHGDLGMVREEDIILGISYSGETDEVRSLLTPLNKIGPGIIAMTGYPDSILGDSADVVLDISVAQEAGPLDLAPTASSAATLAMGDALAMTLLDEQNFQEEDFARYHPGGSLGKQLLLDVSDIMHTGNDIPLVETTVTMKEAIFEMTEKRLGITGIINDREQLVGCLTDGDLRRIIENRQGEFFQSQLTDVMTEDPITIESDLRAADALEIMEEHEITVLFILDDADRPEGVIHMHDILQEGIQSN
ncbi:MAG: SIS domain-containing protein [bacterium]